MKFSFFLVFLAAYQLYAQNDVVFTANVTGDYQDELILVNTTYSGGAIRALDISTATNLSLVNHGSFSGWMDTTDKMFIGNVNGDFKNRDELVLVNTSYSGGAIKCINVLTGADVYPIINHGSFSGWMDTTDKMFLGDVNGDAKQDLILVNTSYSGGAIRTINLSDGTNISWINHGTFGGWMDATDRMFVGDVNGDGNVDLVLVNTLYSGGAIRAIDLQTGVNISLINHGAFANMMDSNDKIFLTDLNGDGKKDMLFVNANCNITQTAIKGVDIYNGGVNLCFPPTMPSTTPILHGTYNGFFDNCDRVYCQDIDGDSKSELILINTSTKGEAIRVINPTTGYTKLFYNQMLDGWVDPNDRILFPKQLNSIKNILLLNASYSGGAIRTIDCGGNNPVWIDHGSISPSLVGWLDGTYDKDYPVSACTIPAGITFDKIYSGDGSIEKENRPYNYQLFPRKANNLAMVNISGTYPGISTIYFIAKKTDINGIESTIFWLPVSVVNGRFEVGINIHAELSEYSFYYSIGGPDILFAEHVVCGDAYIISGQSNAITQDLSQTEIENLNSTYGSTTVFGKYSRTLGSIWSPNGEWGVSQIAPIGDATRMVGAWGLVMQYELQARDSVPTCILNGAIGGTSIAQHLPNSSIGEYFYTNNPILTTNPYTSLTEARCPGYYDRYFTHLNTRVYNAGLENDISGIFWLQGEGGSMYYENEFTPLYNYWDKFFPDFKKVYLLQIHSWVEENIEDEVRSTSEAQRTMPEHFERMCVMSTNGVGHHRTETSHEIHYTDLGYINIANRLVPLVERDIFNNNSQGNITPPNVTWASIEGNRVRIYFDQSLDENTSDNLLNVLSVIKFNTGYNVKSNPAINGNIFSFDVSSTNVATISYAGFLPNCNSPINPDYPCYLKNSNEIAALSFHNIPVIPASNNRTAIEMNDNRNLLIYPNPFSDELNVSSNDGKNIISVAILNTRGDNVFTKADISNTDATFNLNFLKSGTYFIQVIFEDKTFEYHIISKQ